MGQVQPVPAAGQAAPFQFNAVPAAPANLQFQAQAPPAFAFRRRRHAVALNRVRYTEGQKENAVRLLNLGLSYRQVARMMSPHCSSGTPFRWRREHIRRQEMRRRMDDARRRRAF